MNNYTKWLKVDNLITSDRRNFVNEMYGMGQVSVRIRKTGKKSLSTYNEILIYVKYP